MLTKTWRSGSPRAIEDATTLPARKSDKASTRGLPEFHEVASLVPGKGTLGAIISKCPQGVTMIELVELRLAEFSTQFDLMFADHPREIVGEVASDVVTALGRGLADIIKASYPDAGRTFQGRPGDQSKRGDVEAVVEVVEYLVEVIYSGQNLVGDGRREYVVEDDRVVLNVDRSDLVIVEQLGSDRRDLISLPREPVGGKAVLLVDRPVYLCQAVVTVTVFGIGVEVVVDGWRTASVPRKASGYLGRPKVREEVSRNRIDRNAIFGQCGFAAPLPCRRRFGGRLWNTDLEPLFLKSCEPE